MRCSPRSRGEKREISGAIFLPAIILDKRFLRAANLRFKLELQRRHSEMKMPTVTVTDSYGKESAHWGVQRAEVGAGRETLFLLLEGEDRGGGVSRSENESE